MGERIINVNGVELCAEAFGDSTDPPILLVMGLAGSMLWWDEEFCRRLAAQGRYVIRYDHRDTGRSVAYEPGRPGYTGADLVADTVGVLDAHDIPAAHVVGMSAGGAFAQLLALDHGDRVLSLVLISTSPATTGDRGLPPPSQEFRDFVMSVNVDWTDAESVVEYLVGYGRVLAGTERPFDERSFRAFARREVDRTGNVEALQNHAALADGDREPPPLSSITAATLVVHGTADPMFPVEHGEALAAEIPDARLLVLDGAGHGVEQADWPTITHAIVEHTAARS